MRQTTGESVAGAELAVDGLEDAVSIGRGGHGVVYRATQPRYGRVVAVKVLSADLDPAGRARFERELQAAGSLSTHPNIVSVYDAGTTEDGRPYLVMEYLPGGSLAERTDRGGPMPWPEAVRIGVMIADALQAAHDAGVLHRDVKPANILVSAYGVAQLGDFGIARVEGGDFETTTGVVHASLPHAPPEVLSGDRPDPRSDVYSLATTICELVCGEPPFARSPDEPLAALMARITFHDPPDLRVRGVPNDVCVVLERAMAKDPAQRQQTAAEFGAELGAALGASGSGDLTTSQSPTPPTHLSHRYPEVAPDGPAPRRPGRRAVALAIVAAVLALGAVVGIGVSALVPGDPARAEAATLTVEDLGGDWVQVTSEADASTGHASVFPCGEDAGLVPANGYASVRFESNGGQAALTDTVIDVDTASGSDAAALLAELRAAMGRCDSWVGPDGFTTVTQTVLQGPGLGDDTLWLRRTEEHVTGLAKITDAVVVRQGDRLGIVTVAGDESARSDIGGLARTAADRMS